MIMTKTERKLVKETAYQNLADCIRSDQLSARQVVEEMEADPEFKEWYRAKYLIKNIYS